MSIAFRCPQCGKEYVADDQMAGKGLTCKACGSVVRIPIATAPKAAAPPKSNASAPPKAAPARSSPAAAPKPQQATAKAKEPPPPASLDLYGLEDEPSAVSKVAAPSGIDEEEETTPLLPRAGAYEPPKPKKSAKGKSKPREKSGSSSRGGGFSFGLPGIAGVGGFSASFVTAFMFMKWGCRAARVARMVSRVSSSAPEEPTVRRPARTNVQITSPAFPALGQGVPQDGGALLYEVRLGPDDPTPKDPGHRGRLWVYLPPGEHAEKSLPCVLLAGAGDDPTTGMVLRAGDRQVHLAFARSGYAVVAYEMDGALVNSDDSSEEQDAAALEAFLVAKAGLVNARNAIDYATEKIPQIDTKRFYTAGFGSAGTMAVRLAESDYRIKACMAFNADIDTSVNFDSEARAHLGQMVPGSGELFTTYNPKMHAGDLKCPVFLFSAAFSGGVVDEKTFAFKDELDRLKKPVVLENTQAEDPVAAMMGQGLPHALAWLKSLPADGS
jgi:dienelactone hydrolase